MKGFTLSLALNQWRKATRKSPINGRRSVHFFNVILAFDWQEAYLPPALRTARDMKSMSEDTNPPQLTRRRNYGATSPPSSAQSDHVIDASQLSPSTETVVHVTEEDKR